MSSSDQIICLLLTVFLGAVLGRLKCRGLSLGSSGVIFVALAMGHFGYQVPAIAGSLGLVIFVYCLGIGAGPRFFRMFCESASSLAVVGVAMIFAAALATWLFAKFTALPADLAAGIFAGSLTSTPALAAATESLPPDSQLAVGFGIAYPFGAIGVVLLIQLAPKILGRSMKEDEARENTADPLAEIVKAVAVVANSNLIGKQLSELAILEKCNCQISHSRESEQESMTPIAGGFTLQLGQQLLISGEETDVELVAAFLGKKLPQADFIFDTERHRRRVVATADRIVGRSLQELHLRSRFGVTISQIMRHDLDFVPGVGQTIQFGDALTAVGEPEGLDQFVEFAGHCERSFDETDMISLALGALLGVILGQAHFQIGREDFTLGMAGGPLVVGLILAHFGRIGPIVGHFPRAARLLLTEVGLVLFLATVGVRAGSQLVPVIQTYGLGICLGAVLITLVPLIVGGLLTCLVIRLGLLRSLGCICGAMTSTPGLGALTSSTDSSIPVTSYATVYPIALILMTIMAPLLISFMT